MVIGKYMTTQNYLMVQNTVVTNIVVWDGNIQTWQPPQNATMLVVDTTPTKIWGFENNEFVLVDSVGDADIGFTWDGSFAVTNRPKPELDQTPAENQPQVTGTQTL